MDADVAIGPDVEDIGFWQFDNGAKAMAAGKYTARQALDDDKLATVFREHNSFFSI